MARSFLPHTSLYQVEKNLVWKSNGILGSILLAIFDIFQGVVHLKSMAMFAMFRQLHSARSAASCHIFSILAQQDT